MRARRWVRVNCSFQCTALLITYQMGSLAAELLFDCKENKAHLRGIKTNLWFLLILLSDCFIKADFS